MPEIVINAKLDNREFITDSKQLLSAVKSLQSTTAKMGQSMASSANGYSSAMRKNAQACRELKSQIQELTAKAADMRKTLEMRGEGSGAKQFMDLRAKLKELEKQYVSANEKAAKLEETKGIDSKAFQKAQSDAESLVIRMRELQKQMDSLKVPEKDLLAYQQQEQAISAVEERLGELKEQQSDMGGLGSAFGNVARSAGNAALNIARLAGHGAWTFLKKLASEAKNAAVALARLAANAVSAGLKKIGAGAAYAVKGLLGLNKQSKRANGGLATSLKNILKYAFGIRSLFFLFRRLRAAISEGFGELKRQNPEVKASLDSLSKALSGLKGSLATAFAPILTAVAPMLTTLINMLTTAINTIGAFFAALTGHSTVAKSIGAIGSSAKGSSSSVKKLKRELAGFDELNILNDKNSGGGGGGGSGSGLAYENVPIDEGIKNFVDRLKALWEAADYEGVGNYIASFINKGFEAARDFISWDNVQGTVEDAVAKIAGVFNGLIDPEKGIDFELIGNTFGAGIDTILRSFNLLVTSIEWANVGLGIANFLNGIIDLIDPDVLSETITNAINGPLVAAKKLVTEFSWGAAGTKFGQTVQRLFKRPDIFDNASDIFTRGVLGILEFGKNALDEFKPALAAKRIKDALGRIPWDDIANEALKLFTQAAEKIGDFVTVLFGGDVAYDDPNITRMMRPRPAGLEGNEKSTESKLTKIVGNVISVALKKLDEWINKIPWGDFGTELNNILSSLPWEDWGQKLAQALKDLLLGIDDLISATIYGENYQENETWRSFHPGKAAKYDYQKEFGSSEHGASVLQKRGLTVEDFINMKALANQDVAGAAARGDTKLEQQITEAKDAVAEITHEIAVLDAPGIVESLTEQGASAEMMLDELTRLGLTVDEAIAVSKLSTQATEENTVEVSEEKTAFERFAENGEQVTGDAEANFDAASKFNELASEIDAANVIQAVQELADAGMTADEILQSTLPQASFGALGGKAASEYEAAIAELRKQENEDKGPNGDYTIGLKPIEEAVKDETDAFERFAENGKTSDGATGDAAKALFDEAADGIPAALEQAEQTWGEWLKRDWDNSAKSQKRQIKEEKKLTKALRDKQKPQEVEVDYQGAGFDTDGDKPSLNVGVKFVPEGEDEPPEGGASGLLGWLQELLNADTLEARIALLKEGWESIANFLGLDTNTPFTAAIELIRDNWDTIRSFLGIPENGIIDTIVKALLNKDWPGILAALGLPEDATVGTVIEAVMKSGWKGIRALLGLPDNSTFGTIISAAMKSGWKGIKVLLGIPDNNTFGTLITTGLKTGAKTVLGLLGITSFSPLVQTIVDILTGSVDGDAQTALDNAGKELQSNLKVGVQQTGEKIKGAIETVLNLLGLGDTTTTDTFNVNTNKGGNMSLADAEKADELEGGNSSKNYTFNGEEKGKLTPEEAKTVAQLKSGKNASKKFTYTGTEKGDLTPKEAKSVMALKTTPTAKKTVDATLKKNWKGTIQDALGLNGLVCQIKAQLVIDRNKSSVKIQTGTVVGGQKFSLTYMGQKEGGIIDKYGNVVRFANGGSIMRNGRASWWNSVNKYAAGTTRAHGTVFVAGEAGPEIMGHVNGRTEILNKSQLADALYGAVVSGMGQAVNALGKYLANHMTTCTNAIVTTIGANAQLSAVRGLDYYAPAMATGTVMPYEVTAQIARSTQELKTTLDENNEDLIQAMVSAIGSASMQIVTAIQQQMMRGGNGVSAQQVLNSINQRTLMFGSNPLKGV